MQPLFQVLGQRTDPVQETAEEPQGDWALSATLLPWHKGFLLSGVFV